MAIIAWGRLEGQITACLINILQIGFHRKIKPIGTDLPQQWNAYESLWATAFSLIDELKPFHAEATALMAQIVSESKDRNLIAHGVWRDFRWDVPYTVDILKMKKTKAIPYGIEFFTMPMTIQQLWSIKNTANDLGARLLPFGVLISELSVSIFGPPGPDVRRL
jgi:hypothetical protein